MLWRLSHAFPKGLELKHNIVQTPSFESPVCFFFLYILTACKFKSPVIHKLLPVFTVNCVHRVYLLHTVGLVNVILP